MRIKHPWKSRQSESPRFWKKERIRLKTKMSNDDSNLKPRVNGAMLSQFQGQTVCLLGNAKDVDNNGTSFNLTASDKVDVRIKMREPLNEYVAGLTEVHGEVDAQSNIICNTYVVFPKESTNNFDMDLYNKAVETMSKFPDHYITASPAS